MLQLLKLNMPKKWLVKFVTIWQTPHNTYNDRNDSDCDDESDDNSDSGRTEEIMGDRLSLLVVVHPHFYQASIEMRVTC